MTHYHTDAKQASLAPIVLFAYSRASHIHQTVEALMRIELPAESRLLVFSDGPMAEPGEEKVQFVGENLKMICGFRDVTVVERGKDFDLARSIITGDPGLITEREYING